MRFRVRARSRVRVRVGTRGRIRARARGKLRVSVRGRVRIRLRVSTSVRLGIRMRRQVRSRGKASARVGDRVRVKLPIPPPNTEMLGRLIDPPPPQETTALGTPRETRTGVKKAPPKSQLVVLCHEWSGSVLSAIRQGRSDLVCHRAEGTVRDFGGDHPRKASPAGNGCSSMAASGYPLCPLRGCWGVLSLPGGRPRSLSSPISGPPQHPDSPLGAKTSNDRANPPTPPATTALTLPRERGEKWDSNCPLSLFSPTPRDAPEANRRHAFRSTEPPARQVGRGASAAVVFPPLSGLQSPSRTKPGGRRRYTGQRKG